MDIETRLRHDLAGRAQDIDAAPADLFDAVLDGHRQQRRRRAGVLGAAAVALLAAVTVPLVVTGGPSSSAPPAAPAAPTTVGRTPSATYDLPPRGSLAGDAAYLEGLLDRPWGRGPDALDPDARQVVFAGEVPGGLQALVIGRQDGAWVGMSLHGPAGTAPADLELSDEPGPVDPDLAMTQSWSSDDSGALVVVSRPGDVIELSPGRTVTADGSIVRDPYRVVGDPNGVAVVDLAGIPDLVVSIRVTRDGRLLEELSGAGSGSETQGTDDGYLPAALAGAAGSPDPELVHGTVDGVLPQLGLTVDQVEVTVLWGGPIGNGRQPDATATVLTVRAPSGAVVLAGWYGAGRLGRADGGGFTIYGPCLQAVLPAGTDVAADGVAMVCDSSHPQGGSSLGRRLVVVPPDGTVQLALTGPDGGVLETHAPGGAALVTAAPEGVTGVTARDATGAVLAELPIRGVQDLRAG